MFLLILVTTFLLLLFWNYVRKPVQPEFKCIPLVSRIPFCGCLFSLFTLQPDNLHLKFKEYVERFGRSFHARIFGALIVVTADANYAREILSSTVHTRKHILYNMLSSWLGNGLLLSHGKHWMKMRKIITPTFHFQMLEYFVHVFDRQSSILVMKLQDYADQQVIVDVYKLLGLTTLDVIAEAAMNVQLHAQLNAKSEFVQSVHDDKVNRRVIFYLSVTRILATRFVRPHLAHPRLLRIFAPELQRKQQAGIDYMHKFTENIINKRRAVLAAQHTDESQVEQQKPALLDMLLQTNMHKETLTYKELRDEVNTFMFEGHDTTTSATSFCLYLISRHEKCQQKLFEEIAAHFADEPKRSILFEDLQNLTYLNCVVKESLRLYPPIPAIGRWLNESLSLADGNCLPAGTNVIVLLWQMMRDPEYFEQPESFLPERHLSDSQIKCSYIPFSMGPRNCIGKRFALLEMKTIVVNVLRNFELLPLGAEVQPSIKIVLRSKNGVQMGIKQRDYIK